MFCLPSGRAPESGTEKYSPPLSDMEGRIIDWSSLSIRVLRKRFSAFSTTVHAHQTHRVKRMCAWGFPSFYHEVPNPLSSSTYEVFLNIITHTLICDLIQPVEMPLPLLLLTAHPTASQLSELHSIRSPAFISDRSILREQNFIHNNSALLVNHESDRSLHCIISRLPGKRPKLQLIFRRCG